MSGWRVSLLLAGLALVEVTVAVVLAVLAQMSFNDALEGFVVTNGLMGASFASCGAIVAGQRQARVVGWLFIAVGLGHATGALAMPLAQYVHDQAGPVVVQRLAATALMYSWPWSIGLFLPLAILLFPDGRPVSRGWGVVAWTVALTSPLFVLEMGLGPDPVAEGLYPGYITLPSYDDLTVLWTIAEIRTSLAIALAVVSLVVRYRSGDEHRRRQLLWLLLAGLVVVAAVVPWSFAAGTPVLVLLALPLVPAAVTVAIVREHLFDIRLVVSRTVAWLLLSLGALAGYVVLVAALDSVVTARFGRSAVVTVLVAVGVAPVLPRLQRVVDRWMYGDRGDATRIATRVTARLASGDQETLVSVAAAIGAALRLPYVAVSTPDGALTEDGSPPDRTEALPLCYAGEQLGTLTVGLRAGERRLAAADRSTLTLIAASLAVAVRALRLTADVQQSHERIVAVREEERRRIRQDLHDGLGPTLTGIALSADAAANLVDSRPTTTRDLLDALRRDTRTAIADVRRLVDDLRPSALDELGLLGALRQRADQLMWRSDGSTFAVRLRAPDQLPVLPAAVEVAAYRIATEALTNVARHAAATGAVLQVRCDGTLDLEVLDDGAGSAAWCAGVGLTGMRQRALEVHGTFQAGPSGSGGRVFVSIPLGSG